MSPDPQDVSPFSGLIGIEWQRQSPEEGEARIEVRDELKQPYGYLHGGVIASAIDEMCSRCTILEVLMEGSIAMAQTIDISLLRSVKDGYVTVIARRRHRGKTTWIWEAEATDDEGRLCALAKVTVAVRPFERPPADS
jgi:1,4-dihydroxy-2-naphthoyl-CoA hydrolase